MNPPPIIVSQESAASNPDATTLADAVLWDYTFKCVYAAGLPYSVTYNEERTVTYDAVPVDDETSSVQTVVIKGLSAIDAQSARATVGDVRANDACVPNIDNTLTIDIGGNQATLAEHLSSLLHTILGNSPFASQPLRMEVHYAYTIGGVEVKAPVLLLARQDVPIGFDEAFIEQMTSALDQWMAAVQPPSTDARWIFALTMWTAVPRLDATLLRLGNVSLPLSDVIRA